MKQDLLPDNPNDGRYASDAEVREVIALLRKTLREDQVTTDADELLGHGHSPNTYHSESSALFIPQAIEQYPADL